MEYHQTFYNGKLITGIMYNNKKIKQLYKNDQLIFKMIDDGYVHDGLIARYIASKNMKTEYSSSTIIWKDLIGQADLICNLSILPPAVSWGSNYLFSDKTNAVWNTWGTKKLPSDFSLENCTVEYIIMPTHAGSNGGGDIFLFNGSPTTPYTSLDAEMYSLVLRSYAPETSTYTVTGSVTLTANQLISAAVSVQPYDSGTGKKTMYVNGISKASVTRTKPTLYIVRDPIEFNIMGNSGGFPTVDQVYFGRLYEIRIYNRALTLAEINQNYNRDKIVYSF